MAVPLRGGLAHFLRRVVRRGLSFLELISIGSGVVTLLVPVLLEETEENQAEDDTDGQQDSQRDAHNLSRVACVAYARHIDAPRPQSVLFALTDFMTHKAIAVVAREADGAPDEVSDFALAAIGWFVQRWAANHFLAYFFARRLDSCFIGFCSRSIVLISSDDEVEYASFR